ncbi:MAG: prepilin-type N-terminal cleavage/methylation domain-containing protein [candidate division Zixibacteria bacterium]|nr:prepilin-type N-terminal cleavage/methylation domain-containing protein [candidate division Zixibacteria bacterium]
MEPRRLISEHGYSLMELLAVIIIVGIIASVAMKSLTGANDAARSEETKRELDELAWAMVGQPDLVSGGVRTDHGYVGDIGSLPPNLDALVINPGGYSTWEGPYIRDDFYTSPSGSESEFKVDAWGTPYSYSGGVTISSTGSGSTITRKIARIVDDLL